MGEADIKIAESHTEQRISEVGERALLDVVEELDLVALEGDAALSAILLNLIVVHGIVVLLQEVLRRLAMELEGLFHLGGA